MSWPTKYRPRKVMDLHLARVRDVLLKMMAEGKLPHVWLFAGPKGTGKTSTARILAALVNDPKNGAQIDALFFSQPAPKKTALSEPETTSESESIFTGKSFVVQEIDAASNRGIDDIRQLKERIALPPQGGKVAVYILDEVHMLTTEAFNALLKILEEPPSHAVFILATTELHKIPATVVSRCTQLTFYKASPDEIETSLEKVISGEKLEIEPEARRAIAMTADGSFRDGVKLLEATAALGTPITLEMVEQVSGGNASKHISELLMAVTQKDPHRVAQVFKAIRETTIPSAVFYKKVLEYLHSQLLISLGVQTGKVEIEGKVAHYLLTQLQPLDQSGAESVPHLPLEIKMLEIVYKAQEKSSGGSPPHSKPKPPHSPSQPHDVGTHRQIAMTPAATIPVAELKQVQEPETVAVSRPIVGETDITESVSSDMLSNLRPVQAEDSKKLLDAWSDFVRSVSEKNSTIAALLKSAQPITADGKLQIGVFYRFHKDQLEQPKFMSLLQECVANIVGSNLPLEFIVQQPTDKATDTVSTSQPVAKNDLASIADAALL